MADAGHVHPATRTPGPAMPPLPQSPFLLPDRPLVLMPRLATLIGLDEAIVLQQVRYWLGDDRRPHVRDGRRWVYNTYAQWREQLPFFPERTLRRKFVKLEEAGLLESTNYNEDAFDHTKWYTVNFDRLLELESAWRARAAEQGRAREGRATRGGRARAERGDQSGALPPIPGNNLLIDADPLIVLPRLAVAIGLNEAIVLQQVFYWLGDDRRPHVRDGRRWVYNTYAQWREDNFPFWSLRTIQETFLSLENMGLLISEHFSLGRGDRTKWYTIAFDRLDEVLQAAATAGRSHPTLPARAEASQEWPSRNNGRFDDAEMAGRAGQFRALFRSGHDCAMDRPELRDDDADLTASPLAKTTTKISTEIPQKQQAGAPPRAGVVVAGTFSAEFVSQLTERGVTAAVARELVAAYRPERIARQIEFFDWERAGQPDDEKMTPGRLRRRIEQDWAPPPDFVPPAERAERERRQAAEREQWAEQLAEARRAEEEQRARREAEYQALLEAAALDAGEQRRWRMLLDSPRRLHPRLENTLFRAPRDGAPPLVVFRDREDHGVISGPSGGAVRADLLVRLMDRFPEYRREFMTRNVLYVLYEDLVRLLADAEDGDGAAAPTGTGRAASAGGAGERGG